MQQKPILVTTERGAEALGVRKTKFFELIGSGAIETVLLGRRRMVVFTSLETYVERLRHQQNAETT